MERLGELYRVRAGLLAAFFVLARDLSDPGNRAGLDDALAAFGFDRTELEAEFDADIAAGPE